MQGFRMSRWLIALAAVAFTTPGRAAEIDFNRDVRPILSDKCFACHGPDEKHRKAKLRLDVEKDAVESGVIVGKKPGESELLSRITSADETLQMPPPKSGKKLTAAEVEILKKWVKQGG